jgi:hypothetical protein
MEISKWTDDFIDHFMNEIDLFSFYKYFGRRLIIVTEAAANICLDCASSNIFWLHMLEIELLILWFWVMSRTE